jgi:hypothetical protein
MEKECSFERDRGQSFRHVGRGCEPVLYEQVSVPVKTWLTVDTWDLRLLVC